MKKIFFILLAVLFVDSSFALETGKPAPDFELKSVGGVDVSLSEYKGKFVVIEWFNPGCPFVQKHYRNADMQALQKEYLEKGVIWLLINSTNREHRDFQNLEESRKLVDEKGINSSHLLLDIEGVVGKQYGAKTTPHMFIVNKEGTLVYQGAIDNDSSVFAAPASAKNYVRTALDELLAGAEVSNAETKPYGCSVKY